MTDEIWEARRQRLSDEVRAAAVALLAHTRTAAFCIPLNDGVVAAGPRESVAALSGGCPPTVDQPNPEHC